jgi:hypothetical protein
MFFDMRLKIIGPAQVEKKASEGWLVDVAQPWLPPSRYCVLYVPQPIMMSSSFST